MCISDVQTSITGLLWYWRKQEDSHKSSAVIRSIIFFWLFWFFFSIYGRLFVVSLRMPPSTLSQFENLCFKPIRRRHIQQRLKSASKHLLILWKHQYPSVLPVVKCTIMAAEVPSTFQAFSTTVCKMPPRPPQPHPPHPSNMLTEAFQSHGQMTPEITAAGTK